MNILNLEHVTKHFAASEALTDVTIGIEDGDKIGVVGINGTGKSTFLAITAGVMEPDDGQVIRRKGLRTAYLAQDMVFDDEKTLLESITDLTREASDREAYWNTEGEVEQLLLRFGIEDPSCRPSILSGGQKKRASLVTALLTPCDLLILDEPTNHLDLAMISWLQDYLEKYRGALLLVTHDRYFLDAVTNRTIELDRGKAYRYEGGYSEYLEMKQSRLDFQLAAERRMAALYRQDLAWMMRGARARSTKQKAHIQRFEMLQNREKIVEERQAVLSSLPVRLGNKTIEVRGISKSYGGKLLFQDFSYMMTKTDRIGFIGENGCGKSTLLRCLTGLEEPDEGTVEIGQTVQIGYFSQENQFPDPDMRVIDYIQDTAQYIRTQDGLVSASSMLEQFLFTPQMQYNLVGKLSGGEKRRLCLLKVLMESPNVLVLDEPTNDLDIQTLQVLEDYLDHFAGIIIVVSHDRYFLDRVVTRLFAFEEDGRLIQSEGGYSDYILHGGEIPGAGEALKKSRGNEKGRGDDGRQAERSSGSGGTSPSFKGAKDGAAPAADGRNDRGKVKKRLSYNEQREYDSIEEEISKLEEKSKMLDSAMAENAADYTKLEQLSREKEETESLLEEKLERFLELQEMLDSF